MKMNNPIEVAIVVATAAHEGQKDKAGLPYILHPLRVGSAGRTEATQVVGFLHDVLEDTETNPYRILKIFGTEIYEALLSVTRRKGEAYMDYVKRAARNPIGRVVKMNDLKDNTSPERMRVLTQKEQDYLSHKYSEAIAYIQSLN